MVVYKITNNVNNKIYIGCTIDYDRRVRQHKSCKFKGATLLHKAFLKYGANSFSFEIIGSYKSEEEMFKAEVECIKQFNSLDPVGYNLHHGGKGGKICLTEQQYKDRVELGKGLSKINVGNKYNLGRKASKETKQKLSAINKGKKMPQESKDKISKANTGNTHSKGVVRSEEYKKNMSLIKKGVVFPEGTRLKMAIAAKRRVKTMPRESLNGRFVKQNSIQPL